MSLVVWLPLNGDLTQQGLSNVTASGSLTYSDSGKIGKCANVDSGHVLTIPYSSGAAYDFSFSFWIKIPTAMNSNTDWETMLSFRAIDTANSTAVRIIPISYADYHQVKIYDSANHQHSWRTPKYDTWEHWSIVHHSTASSSNIKLYINGVLNGSYDTSNPLILQNGNINIGSGVSVGSFALNDVRIYDHALSAKEVKELAKGLVLHYRLAGPGQENLITGNFSCTSTNTTYQSQGTVGCVLTAADLMANQGRTLILSYDVYSLGDYTQNTAGNWQADRFGIHGAVRYTKTGTSSSIQDYPLAGLLSRGKSGRVYTSWKIPTGIASFDTNLTFSVQTNGREGYAYPASNNSSTWYLKNVKLEWGPVATPWCPNSSDSLYSTLGYNNGIEYDCSGYRRNGTKSGKIAWDIDSPRYTTSYKFNSSTNSAITIPTLSCVTNNGYQTLSCWFKTSGLGAGMMLNGLICLGYGDSLFLDGSGCVCFRIDNGRDLNAISTTESYSDNRWHLATVTYDGSSVKIYVDGKLKNTFSRVMANRYVSSGSFSIGTEANNPPVYMYNGNISDVRIYATALSAEDIAELYHSAVIVDNTGKTYAYEYFEA